MTRGRAVLIAVALVCAPAGRAWSQTDSTRFWISFSGGMGISLSAAPSVVDYVNLVGQPLYAQRLSDFTSMTEFFLNGELRVAGDWALGLEYGYVIKSYSVEGSGSTSQFSYSFHAPGVIAHYLIEGMGYELKFGGGVAYVLGTFSQALYGNPTFVDYSARGASIRVEAVGNTMFDEHFYGTIAVDLRWVAGGTFKDGAQEARYGSTAAGLSAFMAGIKFGIMVRL